jgi:Putative zinc-finger
MTPLQATEDLYQSLVGGSVHLPAELLIAGVEERVTLRERSRIEAHLAGCARCRDDFQALHHFAERQPSAPTPELVITAHPEPSAPPELTLTEEPESSTPVLRLAEASEPATSPTLELPLRHEAKVPPRKRLTWVPLAFLALNGLGLGVVYRLASSRSTPAPPPQKAATPAPRTDTAPELARFQAAYELQLAQERGKVAQLEKQVQALRLAPKTTLPTKTTLPIRVTALATPLPLPVLLPPRPSRKSTTGLAVVAEPMLSPKSLTLASLSVHPQLQWTPVPRASFYNAVLTDSVGKPISTTELRKPEWRVAAALKRGETYRWSVVPRDRAKKPLGEPQLGELTIAPEETVVRISEQLKALATELESAGLTSEAAQLREQEELLQKK